MQNALNLLMSGNFRDPDAPGTVPAPPTHVIIDLGVLSKIHEILSPLEIGKNLVLVADGNTYTVLGQRVEAFLLQRYEVQRMILPKPVFADVKTAELITKQALNADAIIAVGSGTINDLCKYASFEKGIPYIIFGTAPSMNGYSSETASLSIMGTKNSFAAHLPRAIIMDLDTLIHCPMRSIRSGIGDLLARSTAQADWMLSSYLLGTPYATLPFELQKDEEQLLVSEKIHPASRDRDSIFALANHIMLSGFGMYYAKGSYPASQSEHLLAHYMETRYGDQNPKSLHGEQIGVTTLTMARLQEWMLAKEKLEFFPSYFNSKSIIAHFGPNLGSLCAEVFKKKPFTGDRIDAMNDYCNKHWLNIRDKIRAVMIPSKQIEAVLKKAGSPVHYLELGWSHQDYGSALLHAMLLRDRFTFLDLAHLSAELEEFVEVEVSKY